MSSEPQVAGKESVIVIDAEGSVLGRLATYVARMLKEGYKVYVVNVEKAVISGDKNRVIEGYKVWLKIKTLRNPERSPKRPRNPVAIFKYAVRGMLPKDFTKGRARLKNLKVYVGIPKELEGRDMVRLVSASSSKLKGEFITVAEVAKALGWRP